MKWLNRLTDCVDYIEEHIHDEINMDVLCHKACLSRLYFFRLFEAVTGLPLRDYIRNRKMTLAAKELLIDHVKVIDIAFKYGYSSSESFSRAFKSVHGISPSQAKTKGNKLKSHGKLSFNITIRGDEDIKYVIEKKPAFQVLGASIETTVELNENFKIIPQFWTDLREDDRMTAMCNLSSIENQMFGICAEEDPITKSFSYIACVPYANGELGEFTIFEIPASTWAIFECVGPMPEAIQKVWERIFSDWIPSTGYEIANSPQVEYYHPGSPWDKDYLSEIWIPILDKK